MRHNHKKAQKALDKVKPKTAVYTKNVHKVLGFAII